MKGLMREFSTLREELRGAFFSKEEEVEKPKIQPDFDIHPIQKEKIIKPFKDWLYSNHNRGLFLGFRKCGKTDLITIYLISHWIAENPNRTVIIMTRKQDRYRAILRKIGNNLMSIGLNGSFGEDQIRLTKKKQPTVLGLTVNSTTKMWHADLLICDDPVEPTDEYSTALKNRVELIYRESKNIATRVFVIGQYVAIDDIYMKLRDNKRIYKIQFWIDEAPKDLIELLDIDIEELKEDKVNFGKNYEGVIYPSEDSPFSGVITGDYSKAIYNYALMDPSNGKNDYSAIVYLKDFGNFVAIKGKMYKSDWITAVESELADLRKLDRFYWEENTIGASGYHFFKEKLGTKAYRFITTQNKVEKILQLTRYIKAGQIRICESSDKIFKETVRNWSPKAGNNQIDDSVDALSMIIQRLNIFYKK
jgi:hypothetical protein